MCFGPEVRSNSFGYVGSGVEWIRVVATLVHCRVDWVVVTRGLGLGGSWQIWQLAFGPAEKGDFVKLWDVCFKKTSTPPAPVQAARCPARRTSCGIDRPQAISRELAHVTTFDLF